MLEENKKHSVIAISGMPGAGKTTLSSELMNTIPNLVYFDFGAFFRPITYHLIKEEKMPIEELQQIVRSDKTDELAENMKIGHRKQNRICEISVNEKFFKESELYNPEMNKLTVDVGSCFGDTLNKYIKDIIDEVRQSNPVLLNARRPFAVCNDISNHIFLKADFYKRAERKSELEETSIEEARDKLRARDEKEINAEFWKTYPFSKIIDTTQIDRRTTLDIAKKHILEYTIQDAQISNQNQEIK